MMGSSPDHRSVLKQMRTRHVCDRMCAERQAGMNLGSTGVSNPGVNHASRQRFIRTYVRYGRSIRSDVRYGRSIRSDVQPIY